MERENSDDERWVNAIKEHFKTGMAHLCGQGIASWAANKLPSCSLKVFSDRFKIERGNAQRTLKHGQMSFGLFVAILAELHADYQDLPKRPINLQLAIAGYAAAIGFCRWGTQWAKNHLEDAIRADEWCCLVCAERNPRIGQLLPALQKEGHEHWGDRERGICYDMIDEAKALCRSAGLKWDSGIKDESDFRRVWVDWYQYWEAASREVYYRFVSEFLSDDNER